MVSVAVDCHLLGVMIRHSRRQVCSHGLLSRRMLPMNESDQFCTANRSVRAVRCVVALSSALSMDCKLSFCDGFCFCLL